MGSYVLGRSMARKSKHGSKLSRRDSHQEIKEISRQARKQYIAREIKLELV